MSIMEKMRSSTDSTAMQIVLVIVIAAMFFWYSPTQGDRSQTVVIVNGTQIRDTEYFPKYREAYARAQQRGITSEQEALIGQEVKQEMARDEVLRQIALDLGLTASDRDLMAIIQQDRRFFNPETEEYDKQIYEDYRQSRSVQELEKGFETEVLINKLRWAVMTAADLPESRVRDQYVERESKVDIQFVRVDPESIRNTIEVSDESRTLWMAENGSKIQDQYDSDRNRLYDFPERVDLTVIRFFKETTGPNGEELKTKLEGIRTQVEQGDDLNTLARKWSEDDSALDGGRLTQRRVPTLSQVERDALNGLDDGALTTILENTQSVFFYRLDKRTPAETIALDAVENDIAVELIRSERAALESEKLADDIRTQWAGQGLAPADLIMQAGLKIDQSGLVNRSGGGLGGPPAKMIEAAFELEQGAVLNEVYFDTIGTRQVALVGQVTQRQQADMERFDENKGRVYETALLQVRNSLWELWVDEQVAKAEIIIQ